MGLFSFLKRKPAAEFSSAEDVRRARTRARQRLIGATVLVAVAVIGLPLLLDTAPRPVAVDLPIEVPRKEATAPQVVPPPQRSASEPAAAAPSVVAVPASRPAPRAELPAEPREDVPAAKPPVAETKPAAKPPAATEAARAAALLEGRAAPAVTAPAAAADGRYVVQVGAFAEATGAREARVRVEKLGLKTYTQVVETKDGKRIRVRVGPYAEREQADKAAAQLRASGLAAAVLTL